MVNVFAVPIFFICFREALETSIIVSVLLSFLKQTLGGERDAVKYKKLKWQVIWGTISASIICVVLGSIFIGMFYAIGKDHWSGTENTWEGVFGVLASIIITWMGAALLRISRMQDKWRVKLEKPMEPKAHTKGCWNGFQRWWQNSQMFILPFITVLREGLEAVAFIGGISMTLPATAFPLPVILGFAGGVLVGYFVYKGGNSTSLQTFLVVSTSFLYLVASGLLSKSVWLFEADHWNKVIGADASERGSGPGSYDIRQSVWHVNCCNPKIHGGGGWGIFNGVLGWQNSATYGSILSYNLYWLVVIVAFLTMRYIEKTGHWPLMKPKVTEETKKSETPSKASSIACTDKEAEEGKALSGTLDMER